MPPPKPKRSVVWEFYQKKSTLEAECTVCKKVIKFHGSTSNLMEHLKRKHPTMLQFLDMVDSVESGIIPAVSDANSTSSCVPVTASSASSAGPSSSGANVTVSVPPPTHMITASSTSQSTDTVAAASASGMPTSEQFQFQKTSVPRKPRQTTILGTMKLKELSSGKIKEIDSCLVEAIAEGYLPFSLVENSKFVKLVHALEPRYSLPSRKTLTNRLVNERYLEIRENILKSLDESRNVSLTADMWTSVANEGFLSVTAHYIHEGKLKSAVLSTKEIPERHTGENIASNIRSVMVDWNINDKVFAIVTDNASVMADAANRLGVKHLGCAAHVVNLVVSKNVFEDEQLDDLNSLRQKCRKIVGFFRSSTLASKKLLECQRQLNKKQLKLKQENLTRWNSTYFMVERLVSVKEALIMAFSYVSCPETLTSDEWAVLEDILPLIEPLYELTEEMSGEKYITSSIVIPLIRGCQKAVRAAEPKTIMGISLKHVLVDALSKRMTPYESHSQGICPKATILDPRFKKLGFGIAQNASDAVQQLIAEIEKERETDAGIVIAQGTVETTEADSPVEQAAKKRKKIWGFFIENRKKTDLVSSESTVREDMKIYLSQPLLDFEKKADPIAFWEKNKHAMKSLADAAFKYLCVPATSVPSERVFSKSGQVITDRRNRLKSKVVDKMIFLNANANFK